MQTLEYQCSPPQDLHLSRGIIPAKLAVWCAILSLVLTAIGVPGEYGSVFLSPRQVASILALGLAWICGFTAWLFSLVALIRSAGRRGWLPLVLAVTALCCTVIWSLAYQPHGLGDLH